jgi:hypothetical protein
MRFVLCVLGVLLLTLSLAYAADPYQDVPSDHWAYASLEYLSNQGILEGYPDGYFSGDHTLTRYEFGQATARLLQTLGDGTGNNGTALMAETLRAEFSDQLAQMNAKVDKLSEQVGGMEERVDSLEVATDSQARGITDLDSKLGALKPAPAWSGMLLDRWDFYSQGHTRRFTNRIMFALGYTKQINDEVQAGMRFKTNTGNAANSSTWVLGHDGRTADIFLDRAYVKYSPKWGGSYTAADNTSCQPKLEVYAGMYPNITRDPYYMVLDTDVNLQGLGAVYHFNKDFQILSTATVGVEKDGTEWLDDDTYMLACEVRHSNIGIEGLDAWLGCFGFTHPSQFQGSYFKDNARAGIDLNSDGVVDSGDRFSTNFHTVKGGLQYTFDCVFDHPLAVYGEYMLNNRSNAEDRIDAYNQHTGSHLIYESTDDTGFLLGAQYGKTPEVRGDWAAYARYKEIGANAILDGLGDAGVGGSNVNSLETNFSWMFASNSQLGFTFFLNKMNNAFGLNIPDDRKDQQTFQVDWLFKF